MKVIGLIPARGGSKGVPYKNIKHLKGKPLIQYTIEACENSKLINDYYCSTEDTKIKEVCDTLKCKVIDRPPELAIDTSSMLGVVKHFVTKIDKEYDTLMVLYPTYPLRTHINIDEMLNAYVKTNQNEPMIGMQYPKTHPYLCRYILDNKFRQVMAFNINDMYRRQRYPIFYELSHYCCIIPIHKIKELNNQLYTTNSVPFVMDKRVVDIDTIDDWNYAQYLMK